MLASISKLFLAASVALAVAAAPAPAGSCRGEGAHDHGKARAEAAKDEVTKDEVTKGHDHDKASLRGGQVHLSQEHAFESVFANDGVRIFLYTASQAPAMVRKASGTAVVKFADGRTVTAPLARTEPAESDPAVHFCPMHEEVVQRMTGVCTHCGGMKLFVQDYRRWRNRLEPGPTIPIHANWG